MAKVQYSALLESLRGSIAGTTFHRNFSGEIARTRAIRGRQVTPPQSSSLAATANLVNVWRGLELTWQREWNEFAAENPRRNIWDQVKQLSGFDMFIAVNTARLLGGNQILNFGPTNDLPTVVNLTDVVLGAILLKMTTSPAGVADPDVAVLYTTGWLQFTTSSTRQFYRLTRVFRNEDINGINFYDDWFATHHQPFPQDTDPPHFFGQLNFALYTLNRVSGFVQPFQYFILRTDWP